MRDTRDELYGFIYEGQRYFKCPFPCPFYLEKALDLFMLYTNHYDKFCTDVIGGWMDKYSPDVDAS